jgi:acetyl-CoA carboxylase biotin carboxylase subunit
MVTGLDLVQWQIRIASGEPLNFGQCDVSLAGHSIECRITSEDGFAGFLPSTGRIERLDVPAGPGVRWDAGILAGSDVSLYYDPLLAKLIVHAPDRTAAIDRMARALGELDITGVETSAGFLRRVMAEPDFQEGRFDIRYLETHEALMAPPTDAATLEVIALATALLEHETRKRRATARIDGEGATTGSPWRSLGWRA